MSHCHSVFMLSCLPPSIWCVGVEFVLTSSYINKSVSLSTALVMASRSRQRSTHTAINNNRITVKATDLIYLFMLHVYHCKLIMY